jgi:hypothetical protein
MRVNETGGGLKSGRESGRGGGLGCGAYAGAARMRGDAGADAGADAPCGCGRAGDARMRGGCGAGGRDAMRRDPTRRARSDDADAGRTQPAEESAPIIHVRVR